MTQDVDPDKLRDLALEGKPPSSHEKPESTGLHLLQDIGGETLKDVLDNVVHLAADLAKNELERRHSGLAEPPQPEFADTSTPWDPAKAPRVFAEARTAKELGLEDSDQAVDS